MSFWTYPLANKTLDIFTAPEEFGRVKSLLKELGLDHDVIFHDAEEITQHEQPTSRKLVWVNYGNLTNQDEELEGTVRAIPQDFFNRYQRYKGK